MSSFRSAAESEELGSGGGWALEVSGITKVPAAHRVSQDFGREVPAAHPVSRGYVCVIPFVDHVKFRNGKLYKKGINTEVQYFAE